MDADGKKQPAIRWLLDLIARPKVAESHRVFRVDSGDVQESLGLTRRPGSRYSFQELLKNFSQLQKQVMLARSQPPDQRTYQQRKFLDLEQRVVRYQMLTDAFRPLPFPAFPDPLNAGGDDASKSEKLKEIAQLLRQIPVREKRLATEQVPLSVPSTNPKVPWMAYSTARDNAYVVRVLQHAKPAPAVLKLGAVFDAYARGDAAAFNQSVDAYQRMVIDSNTYCSTGT